jgi:hypothetical protein
MFLGEGQPTGQVVQAVDVCWDSGGVEGGGHDGWMDGNVFERAES